MWACPRVWKKREDDALPKLKKPDSQTLGEETDCDDVGGENPKRVSEQTADLRERCSAIQLKQRLKKTLNV